MAQEFAALNKLDIEVASDKIEDILGVPKEFDLNAVDVDDDDGVLEETKKETKKPAKKK